MSYITAQLAENESIPGPLCFKLTSLKIYTEIVLSFRAFHLQEVLKVFNGTLNVTTEWVEILASYLCS